MRQELVERFGPFLNGAYCSDTEMNWKLSAAGYPPLFLPAMRVAHVHLTSLRRFLRKQVMHGRAFARVRVQSERFSAARAALFTVGAAALPLMLFGRVAARVWRHRTALGDFLRSLPLVMAGLTCWSLGESLGYAGHVRRREAG
jgi:GT2 family glycosyltransferase